MKIFVILRIFPVSLRCLRTLYLLWRKKDGLSKTGWLGIRELSSWKGLGSGHGRKLLVLSIFKKINCILIKTFIEFLTKILFSNFFRSRFCYKCVSIATIRMFYYLVIIFHIWKIHY